MYELRSRVRYSEADERGRLSVTGIMNYLQDCCTMQAEDLGVGLSYLQENHIGWFVTSYQIKLLDEMPMVGEMIVVKTWPYQFRGMFGYRNFTIESEDGHVYVESDSLWILMNLDKLTPVRLPQKMQEVYTTDPQLAGNWNLHKRKLPEQMTEQYDFVVTKMHLDTNHHMNNARYVEAARECVAPDKSVKEIYVEFRKSAVLQDQVHCWSSLQDDRATVALKNQEDDIFAIVEFTIN